MGARVEGFELGAGERSKVPYLEEIGLRPAEARIGCGATKKLEAVGWVSRSSAPSTGAKSARG